MIAAHTYDKFYGTSLDLALRSQEIRFLLIAGVTTDICVNSTVLAAANRDYRVTVLMDGVATLWPEIQAGVLRHLAAEVRPTEDHGSNGRGTQQPLLRVLTVRRPFQAN